jgi:hypothetical protein
MTILSSLRHWSLQRCSDPDGENAQQVIMTSGTGTMQSFDAIGVNGDIADTVSFCCKRKNNSGDLSQNGLSEIPFSQSPRASRRAINQTIVTMDRRPIMPYDPNWTV